MPPSKAVCDLELSALCNAEAQARGYVTSEEARLWATILRQVTVVERRMCAARALLSTSLPGWSARRLSPHRVRAASPGQPCGASAVGPSQHTPGRLSHRGELLLEKYRRLLEAIKMDNTREVMRMLDQGVPLSGPPELRMRPVLHEACLHASRQTVEVVLDAGAEVNQKETYSGRAALHYAAGRADPSIVSVLLEHQADVTTQDVSGSAPLDNALTDGGAIAVVKALLKAERSLGIQRLPQLVHEAAKAGHLSALQLFFEEELSLPTLQYGPTDATPLHTAAAAGQTAVVQWLLECGADIGALDAEGGTAMHSAVGSRRCEGVLAALLKAKVNVEHTNRHGHTAFAVAASCGNEAALRLLTPVMALYSRHSHRPLSDASRAHDLLRARWLPSSRPLSVTETLQTGSHLPVKSQPVPLHVARPSHGLEVTPLPRATSRMLAQNLAACDDVGSVAQMKTALRYAEVAAGRASMDEGHTLSGAKRWSPLDDRERLRARRALQEASRGLYRSSSSISSPKTAFPQSPVLQTLVAPWRLLELQ